MTVVTLRLKSWSQRLDMFDALSLGLLACIASDTLGIKAPRPVDLGRDYRARS